MPTPRQGRRGEFSVVLVTCPAEAAQAIARVVLDAHAAACVSVLPGVRSVYRWKGKVEEAEESLLLMKTRTALVKELERAVRAVHPYEVPEIIALPVAGGNRRYLDWILESTKGPRRASPR